MSDWTEPQRIKLADSYITVVDNLPMTDMIKALFFLNEFIGIYIRGKWYLEDSYYKLTKSNWKTFIKNSKTS